MSLLAEDLRFAARLFRKSPGFTVVAILTLAPSLSVPQYMFLTRQPQPFARLAASSALNGGFNLTGEGRPERVMGTRVTQSFFEVLGIAPILGRGFLPEEDVA